MAIRAKEYVEFNGEAVRRTDAVLRRIRNALNKIRGRNVPVREETVQDLMKMERTLSALAEPEGTMASEQIDELIISTGELGRILGQPVGNDTVKDMMADSDEDREAMEEELGEYTEIYGAIPAEEISSRLAQREFRTTEEWIGEFQSRISDKDGYVDNAILGKYKAKDEDDLENLAMIMATMSLAARERNGGTEQGKVSLAEIREKASEIKASTSFQQYVDYIKKTDHWEDNKKAAKEAKAEKMQKVMIAYLSTKSMEQLYNEPPLLGFIPTVGDRLAYLRRLMARAHDVTAAAAEMVVLMNMSKGKTDRPLTVLDRISMADKVNTLKNSRLFRSVANTKEGKEMLLKDKVGDFMNTMREAGRNMPKEMVFHDSDGPDGFVNIDVEFKTVHNEEDEAALKVINADTVGGTMLACREKAKDLADQIRDTYEPQKVSQLITQAKTLVTEYFVLNGFLMKKDGSYDLDNLQQNQEKDVDWVKFNNQMANAMSKPPLGLLFEKFDERKAMTMLRDLQNSEFPDFFIKLGEDYQRAVNEKNRGSEQQEQRENVPVQKNNPVEKAEEEVRILLPDNDYDQQ